MRSYEVKDMYQNILYESSYRLTSANNKKNLIFYICYKLDINKYFLTLLYDRR